MECAAARQKIERALGQFGRMGERIAQETAHVEPGATDHDSGTACPGSEQTRDCAGAGDLPRGGAQGPALSK
jgi:hypothetical protein